MKLIGGWIADVIHHHQDEQKIAEIRNEVAELCQSYPIYSVE